MSPICLTVLQCPPDFVTIRAPLYAIATQTYMLMIVSFGHKEKEASKHKPVTAIAMQPNQCLEVVKTQLWVVSFYAQQSIIDKASICGKNITKLNRISHTSRGNLFLLLVKSEAMWLNQEELRFKSKMLFWKQPSEACKWFFYIFKSAFSGHLVSLVQFSFRCQSVLQFR